METRAKQMLAILRAHGIEKETGIGIKEMPQIDKQELMEEAWIEEPTEPIPKVLTEKKPKLRGLLFRKLIKHEKPEEVKPIIKAEAKAGEIKARTELPNEIMPEMKEKKFHLRGMLYEKLKKEEQIAYPKFAVKPSGMTQDVMKAGSKERVMYPLINPYAFADIKFEPSENELVYHVVEPELNDVEKQVIKKLGEGLIQVIDISLKDLKKEESMLDFIEENVKRLLEEYDFHLNEKNYLNVMYYIYRDYIGLNEIEPFLRDPYIEDIGCDGTNIPIYIVHQRYGSLKTNIIYHDESRLKEFVTKLAERCDRFISYAEPLLDGALPDGTRVHASLAGDVTTRGPTFSIRKFREEPFTPVDITRLNTASPEMLAYLWFVVEHGANILITGGVATGKTSLLNCISLFIPPEAKVVSIEDTRELSLPHENWIPGVARIGFTGTGVGEVTMFDLLKESFRQNPDYLIVGEIRGKEAYVMFQAMASGHPSISTMHAGSVDDVIKRLRTEPINLSPGLLETLDIIMIMVHAREKGKSARRVKELVEIQNIDVDTGTARTNKVFTWIPSQDSFEYRGDSWVLHKISTEKGISLNDIVRDISRRKKFINWMIENNITGMSEAAKNISMYLRNPEKVNSMIGYE